MSNPVETEGVQAAVTSGVSVAHAGNGVPAAPPAVPKEAPVVVVGTKEWDALTERRGELIDEKHEEGLTDAEGEEYERLQRITRKAISVAFPPPVFPPLPKLTED